MQDTRLISNSAGQGGGIYSHGALTITRSELSGNARRSFAAGDQNEVWGGGVRALDRLWMVDFTGLKRVALPIASR